MTGSDDPMASVGAAVRTGARRLTPEGAALDAQLLLAHVLGQSRSWLLAHHEEPLPAAARQRFNELLERRANGEPLAYIVGEREFWSLPLMVTPAVLVPRPETELVVERVLALLEHGAAAVADLGTGSGAIALALATERPLWQITATDQSTAALAVARENVRQLGLGNVRLVAGRWLTPLRGERFAAIASNPPYIAAGDPALAHPALRHEPAAALHSGPDGLEDLNEIITSAYDQLLPGGWLVLEHGITQAPAVATMLVARGYAHVRCHVDLTGRPRVTEARRP